MKTFIYNSYGDKYEIISIEYAQFNGKDTIVNYKVQDMLDNNNTYTARFDGWLSLEQILSELKEIIEK